MKDKEYVIDEEFGGLGEVNAFKNIAGIDPFSINSVLFRTDKELLDPIKDIPNKFYETDPPIVTDCVAFKLSLCLDINGDIRVNHIMATNYYGQVVFDMAISIEGQVQKLFTNKYLWGEKEFQVFDPESTYNFDIAVICFKHFVTGKRLISYGDQALGLRLLGFTDVEIARLNVVDVSNLNQFKRDGLFRNADMVSVMHRYLNLDPQIVLSPDLVCNYSLFLFRVFKNRSVFSVLKESMTLTNMVYFIYFVTLLPFVF